MFPKKAGVIIHSSENRQRKRRKHIVRTARRTRRRAGGRFSNSLVIFVEGRRATNVKLIRKEVR